MPRRLYFCGILFFVSTGVWANERQLPQPLTLDQALSFVAEAHPDLVLSQAQLSRSQAQLEIARSNIGLDINTQARARWVEPPAAVSDLGRDDHGLILQGRKTLYDFGRSGNKEDAALANLEASESSLQHATLVRRYDIMAAFFDVILADIRFNRDNEDMAISFIRYDRIRERQELGQHSDIDVMEANADYQEVLRRRMYSESMQRVTRTRLAELLNHPHSVPSKVVPPNLNYDKRKLAEVEKLQKLADEKNLQLLAIRKKLSAAKEILASLRSEYWPTVRAEVDLGLYSRELGANDLWRAGVTVDMPIYQGGRVGARKAEQVSSIRSIEAELQAKQIVVRNAVLETWLNIENLKLKQREMQAKADYRELYLDRARALYEMEVKTDLGDAMVKLTQASLDSANVLFEQALAWEQLNILTGGNLEELNQ